MISMKLIADKNGQQPEQREYVWRRQKQQQTNDSYVDTVNGLSHSVLYPFPGFHRVEGG